MKKLQNKKGFTLIELLVVIAIIGILATGATATYTSQIQKARDTTRINDIKALQSGVEQSYNDTSEYPRGSTLSGELVKYLGKIPTDSKYGQPCNNGGNSADATACAYAYVTGEDNNGIMYGEYELSTGFENSGNVTSKAKTDGGSDSDGGGQSRLEVGIDIANNVTKVAPSITNTVKGIVKSDGSNIADSTDDTKIVLINGNG